VDLGIVVDTPVVVADTVVVAATVVIGGAAVVGAELEVEAVIVVAIARGCVVDASSARSPHAAATTPNTTKSATKNVPLQRRTTTSAV
jgi:hypothetical protein